MPLCGLLLYFCVTVYKHDLIIQCTFECSSHWYIKPCWHHRRCLLPFRCLLFLFMLLHINTHQCLSRFPFNHSCCWTVWFSMLLLTLKSLGDAFHLTAAFHFAMFYHPVFVLSHHLGFVLLLLLLSCSVCYHSVSCCLSNNAYCDDVYCCSFLQDLACSCCLQLSLQFVQILLYTYTTHVLAKNLCMTLD